MKTLVSEETVKIPKGVKVSIKCKKVEVSGKFGTLKRDFKHLPIELWIEKGQNCIKARMYFAKSKQIAALRTVCSHIQNLFDGVEKKFEYKMRLVYAHFPINASITNGGKTVEIRNYLGEKNVRVINLLHHHAFRRVCLHLVVLGPRRRRHADRPGPRVGAADG